MPGKFVQKRRSKYRNVRVVVDGIKFASKREAKRWGELRLLEQAGRIEWLRRQVAYPLEVNGMAVATYVADFVYHDADSEVVEDAKGVRTPEYKLKKRLMLACLGIEIREV